MSDYRALLDSIEAEIDRAADEGERDELVGILVAIRDVRADLGSLAKWAEARLLPLAGEKRWQVPSIGEVTIRRKTKRTGWRHDEMLPALIARIMDEKETLYDPETGELLPYVQIGHNLTRRLRSCVSFGAGKVTGLREIGLQPDEWCNEESDGWGVELPGRRD